MRTKTREQQLRILERKDDLPKENEVGSEQAMQEAFQHSRQPRHPDARQSELPVSRGGMNQESRHNKHNDPGQGRHKPERT